ncbi:hypothetical protein ACFYO1_18240 [Nocardia sp. NPDC006044]|uniref:hypothetical protein n=1 Tax=Nocardia sp. NPDC006044 TaxID=3364306 RepID=UPI0036CFA6B1
MLTLHDPTKPTTSGSSPITEFTRAATILADQVTPPTKSTGPLHKLLTVLVKTAIDDPDETYTAQDIIVAYQKLCALARARVQEWAEDTARCKRYLDNELNRKLAGELLRIQRDQEKRLDSLRQAEVVVITRGTDPSQAINIMTYETFGGEVPGPARTNAPTDPDAGRQTGEGVKTTKEGRLEEWSLGALRGFAASGFLLIAEATPSMVSLPPGTALTSGERGVCGFADQRVRRVAILEQGRVATGIDPFVRALEIMMKGSANAESALQYAIKKRPT